MFYSGNFLVLNSEIIEQSVVILWVNWWINKRFWQRFTCMTPNWYELTSWHYQRYDKHLPCLVDLVDVKGRPLKASELFGPFCIPAPPCQNFNPCLHNYYYLISCNIKICRENLALLSLYTFWGKLLLFQFLNDKIHNYVLFDIIVNLLGTIHKGRLLKGVGRGIY